MKECLLYKKLKNGKVQCRTCNHCCVIENGQVGKCGVRQNKNGALFSLVYGQPCAINIDPIEKKPLYHFLPGTKTLSIATVGCNFTCHACQNHQISQIGKGLGFTTFNKEIAPEKIVEMALGSKCPSISYTYTEPTVFLEYAFDIMKIAKQTGLKNIWVSNGFFSPQTFELILPHLDAANIDLKSFDDKFYQKYCGGRLAPILKNLKKLKQAPSTSSRQAVWLEVTTLVIPTLNDSPTIFEKIAEFIANDLGPEIPWHISRFSPEISWKLKHLPATPLATLETAYEISQKYGLKNVHLGNV